MRKYNPYRNIFYYYRGPSSKKEGLVDKQIENNTTKALINTLENSNIELLKYFLKKVNIEVYNLESIYFELQIAEDFSRPDAVIHVNKCNFFIESKVEASLTEEQIKRHLESIIKDDNTGFLICITPREKDGNIVKKINKSNLRFISWENIYVYFKSYLRKSSDDKSIFIIQEFLEYMEAINMAPLTGWDKKDFEAFLNIEENDPKKELRLRVKRKLEQYLIELNKALNKDTYYGKLEYDVGNIQKGDKSTWGVLCKSPLKNKVHIPHFYFGINADEFNLGINIGSKNSVDKMKKEIQTHCDRFFNILNELDNFDFHLIERIPTSQIRRFIGKEIITIKLRKNLSLKDVEYIMQKLIEYHLVGIQLTKTFKRDCIDIQDEKFLYQSVDIMKQLKDYYHFSLCKGS
jgi:hypothetical protein